MKPRAYTPEEAREIFYRQVKALCEYWSTVEGKSDLERCEGVAFSIMNIFDGTTFNLPAIDLVLAPHPDDKPFAKSQGENWFEEGLVINDCELHGEFASKYMI